MTWLLASVVSFAGWILALPLISDGRPYFPPDLDPLRCYAKASTSYYDGEIGYRIPQSGDFHSTVACWPKDGCFLASNGDAMCWRVAKVNKR